MDLQHQQYTRIKKKVDSIIEKAKSQEAIYSAELENVHPVYKKSASNLIHYLALRSFEIDELQQDLRNLGLPGLSEIEGHVMRSLYNLKDILSVLLNNVKEVYPAGYITPKASEKILRKNSKLLFGYKSKKRRTRIMVTLPNTAADDFPFVRKLVESGMNCARINCAHDDPEIWARMISNVKEASGKLKRNVKIAMDLGGPKLRTGQIIPGPKVIHIKPLRNDLGQVIQPANIWIAPPDIPPPPNKEADAIIPVHEVLFQQIKRASTIRFIDARGKKVQIQVKKKEGKGKWGICSDSAYVETGTELNVHKIKRSGKAVQRVGEMLPKEQFIRLFTGDMLILHKDQRPGQSAVYNEDGQLVSAAHISCTLPEIFDDVKKGEPIFFDDGKIEGIIEAVDSNEIFVNVLHAKDRGSKLKADKGINLPDSNLSVSGLTLKDRQDLEYVSDHADAINYSFVNKAADVEELHAVLEKRDRMPVLF
jgi:pyruvate kinase